MRKWEFQSSSSPKIYATQINESTGLLSCDCPGWTVKKLGKTRECKHTKKVKVDEGLVVEVRDDQEFVVKAGVNPANPNTQIFVDPVDVGKTASQIRSDTGFISPMLASKMPDGKTVDDYDTPDYIMEEKFDGHRIVVRVSDNGVVTAWSRLGNVRTLPDHISETMAEMPFGLYDGELIVPGQHSYDVTEGQNSGTENLVLFDMIESMGTSIAKEPWYTRRDFLEMAYTALSPDNNCIFLTFVGRPSSEGVKVIWNSSGEGAIIKNINAKYQPGWRTPDWIKVKKVLAATLTVIGYQTGKNGEYSVVKLRDDNGIETTVKTLDNATLRDLQANPVRHIGRRLVISYQEKMPSGKYRHPMWDHWAGVGE